MVPGICQTLIYGQQHIAISHFIFQWGGGPPPPSSSSIDSATLGGSWSVQQFYSTPVYTRPLPSNQ